MFVPAKVTCFLELPQLLLLALCCMLYILLATQRMLHSLYSTTAHLYVQYSCCCSTAGQAFRQRTIYRYIIEGSLEVKLPTIWTNEKQRREESEKRRQEERRSKKRKSEKKEDPGARKGRSRETLCFSNDLFEK